MIFFLTHLILPFYLERSFLEILMLELYFINRFHVLSPLVSSRPYRITSDISLIFSGIYKKRVKIALSGPQKLTNRVSLSLYLSGS